MDIHESKSFKDSKKQAVEIMGSTSKTQELLKKVMETSGKNQGFFDTIWDDLQTLIKLVRSWNRGEYRDIGQKTMLVFVGALVYFISPIDAIPDFIPFLGWADDLTLLAYVVKTLKGELDKYRMWEKAKFAGDFTEAEEV